MAFNPAVLQSRTNTVVTADNSPEKPKPKKKETSFVKNEEPLLPVSKKIKKENDSQSSKKRPGKPVDTVGSLRKIQRDTTRRRFFRQCCDPDSLLWRAPPPGSEKETLRVRLFDRAATEPIDIIFADNPGPTRHVKETALRKVIKWQVTKDRANYKGKPPKRVTSYDNELDFD